MDELRRQAARVRKGTPPKRSPTTATKTRPAAPHRRHSHSCYWQASRVELELLSVCADKPSAHPLRGDEVRALRELRRQSPDSAFVLFVLSVVVVGSVAY
jgi:hypothetical protein